MKTRSLDSSAFSLRCRRTDPLSFHGNNRGQAVVEFTLVFLLLVIVAWIPADFGLAFFTGQLAQNAAREGARIGAADPGVASQVGNCTVLVDCFSLNATTVLYRTALRVSTALMPDTALALSMTGAGCNQMVQMQVTGTYNFFFYRLLNLFGANVGRSTPITRTTAMRWEHQC